MHFNAKIYEIFIAFSCWFTQVTSVYEILIAPALEGEKSKYDIRLQLAISGGKIKRRASYYQDISSSHNLKMRSTAFLFLPGALLNILPAVIVQELGGKIRNKIWKELRKYYFSSAVTMFYKGQTSKCCRGTLI